MDSWIFFFLFLMVSWQNIKNESVHQTLEKTSSSLLADNIGYIGTRWKIDK